jgi:hypothetical protein
MPLPVHPEKPAERRKRWASSIQETKVPLERIPPGDPGNPKKIAELVEFCRGLIRTNLAAKREERARRRKGLLGFLRQLRHLFRKTNQRP